jgi:hypothetical protein
MVSPARKALLRTPQNSSPAFNGSVSEVNKKMKTVLNNFIYFLNSLMPNISKLPASAGITRLISQMPKDVANIPTVFALNNCTT